MFSRLCLIVLCLFSYAVQAGNYGGFTVREYKPKQEKLALYLKDDKGLPFQRFTRLKEWLAQHHEQLVFAVNAGMYQVDFNPVGLLVADGQQMGKLNLRNASGNFYMKPNGVF